MRRPGPLSTARGRSGSGKAGDTPAALSKTRRALTAPASVTTSYVSSLRRETEMASSRSQSMGRESRNPAALWKKSVERTSRRVNGAIDSGGASATRARRHAPRHSES